MVRLFVGLLWAVAGLANIGLTGFIMWAIYKLVTHATGG